MYRLSLIVAFLFCIHGSLSAESNFSPSPASGADVGYILFSPTTQETLLAHNTNKLFSYASNVKLLTAWVALEKLGGGFRYHTHFIYDPQIRVLYIQAGGDLAMVTEDLLAIALELKIRGVTQVDSVVIDDFLYGDAGVVVSAGHGSGDRSYLADASPLCLNYNAVQITISPTTVGHKADVWIHTPSAYFLIDNQTKTVAGTGRRLKVSTTATDDHRTQVTVSGTVGRDRKRPPRYSRKIYHPTYHYAAALLHALSIDVEPPIIRRNLPEDMIKKNRYIRYTFQSIPLREIVRKMNLHSSNMMAESIQCYLGQKFSGGAENGVEFLKSYAFQELQESANIINGSGLGKNYLTPQFMVKLLNHAYGNVFLSIDFFGSLPVFGEEGTLRRTPGFDQPGVARAKTGLLTGVSSMSGLMRNEAGDVYLFTFVVNNYPGAASVDRITYRNRFLRYVWENVINGETK